MNKMLGEKQKNHFVALAKQLNSDYQTKPFERCHDNYVGYFKNNVATSSSENLWFTRDLREKHAEDIGLTENKLRKMHNDKVILVVLESPHVDEYNGVCSVAPAPALGMTGNMLERYFTELISDYVGDEKYHVILGNAVQYQCSLGVDTKIYRDRIWLNTWLCSEARTLFKQRLATYQPDIVINLCTQGSHTKDPLAPPGTKSVINPKYIQSVCAEQAIHANIQIPSRTTLKELTQLAIEEVSGQRLHLSGPHPSSWYSGRNRRIQSV